MGDAVAKEHHGREQVGSGIGLLLEMFAMIWGVYSFALGAALFFSLAASSYTKKTMSSWGLWARWMARAGIAIAITIIMCAIPFTESHLSSTKQEHSPSAQSAATPTTPTQEAATKPQEIPTGGPIVTKKEAARQRKAKTSVEQSQQNQGSNGTNTQIGTAQAPVAIAPNGIANAAPNLGTQTVNNTFSDKYPRPGQVPNVNFCLSKSAPVGDHYETVITIGTDTDITAPFWALFFDGPVADANITIPNIKEQFGFNHGHPSLSQEVTLPLETLPVKSRLFLTANAGSTTISSAENILRIQINEIGNPFGGPFRPWGAGDRLTVTIRSGQSVQLVAIASGYGTEFLEENMTTRCD